MYICTHYVVTSSKREWKYRIPFCEVNFGYLLQTFVSKLRNVFSWSVPSVLQEINTGSKKLDATHQKNI